jgi:flagellar biogenesis protein FliO
VSQTASYPHLPMQTRLLLIASALLAVIILVAGGIWLIRLLA